MKGKTSGITDGTVLILRYTDIDGTIDTAIVKNNRFTLEADLVSSPVKAIIHTQDFSQYRMLWLEENAMTLDASNSDLKNAMVTGSETESLSQSLYQKINDVPKIW